MDACYTYCIDSDHFADIYRKWYGKEPSNEEFEKFCNMFNVDLKRDHIVNYLDDAVEEIMTVLFGAKTVSSDEDDCEEEEWQEVYNAGEHNKNAKPQLFKDVKGDTLPEYNEFKYYQTYGGGPEGGYITDGIIVAKVHRDWGIPFSVEVIKGTLIFRPGNNMEGRSNAIKITLE